MSLTRSFDDPLSTTDVRDNSINLNSLYCSHLWTNSNLRNAIITGPPSRSKNMITYCYTCKGKIRKYEVKSPKNFTPHNHSTPNKEITIDKEEPAVNERQEYAIDKNTSQGVCSFNNSISNDFESSNVESKRRIPSISQQISDKTTIHGDSSFRHKYISYEMETSGIRQQRLRTNLKGFGCIVNFAMTDSTMKKGTQIKACSISIMIVAIVLISFVLVNFTSPNFKSVSNNTSTTVVPIKVLDFNETSSTISNVYSDLLPLSGINVTEEYLTTTESTRNVSNEKSAAHVNVISKVRKNIRTYPKTSNKKEITSKPEDINNKNLSQQFCSCQKDEICMLDENSGTSICKKPRDNDDPTDACREEKRAEDGCGGLCALETEACQLVDKSRGVRVCRLLTLVTCSPEEFRCRNGVCVPAAARCDGSIQCYDRSDEIHCDCDLTKQFRCGLSISCFPHTKLCDGVIDCWDGYDEVNCTVACPGNQFTCNSGQCIAASRFCDSLADCMDGSDEPDGCGGNCAAHEIQCKNHRCVPHTRLCDGHDNCGDATDELHCS